MPRVGGGGISGSREAVIGNSVGLDVKLLRRVLEAVLGAVSLETDALPLEGRADLCA